MKKPQGPVPNHTHSFSAECHKIPTIEQRLGKKLSDGGWEREWKLRLQLLFKVSYGTSYSWDVFLIGVNQ